MIANHVQNCANHLEPSELGVWLLSLEAIPSCASSQNTFLAASQIRS